MTDPSDTPSGRWGHIFYGTGEYHPSHSRQEWKQIADAIRSADRVHAAATLVVTDPAPVRGDDAWCQIAINMYTWLHSADAHRQSPDDEPRCFADENLVRAWLDAPWVPPDAEAETVAQMTGYDVQFEQGRLPDPSTITMLVDTAQDAGVFGIPRHRINLWRFFGDGTLPPHTFILTVRPQDGPGVNSSLVGADRLLQIGGEPVTVIADLLRSVADVASEVLSSAGLGNADAARSTHDHDHASEPPPPVPQGVQGWPVGIRGRPFPTLTGEQPASASPSAAPPSPVRAPRRPRT
jgi:hypothetical protein